MYDKLRIAAEKIQSIKKGVPRVGLVLGSGLGAFVESVNDTTIIPYSQIPHFRETSVEGHEGQLILGEVKGINVAILQGRVHAYEGFPMEEIAFPIRTLATLGVDTMILTNASGGINESFAPGDLIMIDDHINFMGKNPLVGPNICELGPRFPDMTNAYDPKLKDIFLAAADELKYNLKRGTYCSVLGPTYETPAEVRMLKILGADMVGMSTTPEAIAANHLGLMVGGISCITNMAAGISLKKLVHQEVKEEAVKVISIFSNLLTKSIEKIGQMEN